MSEQNTEQRPEDQDPESGEVGSSSSSDKPESKSSRDTLPKLDTPPERFAAYDKQLERFVAGVHDTKAKAKAAAKAAGVDGARVEVRSV